jgi:hypothetical protein
MACVGGYHLSVLWGSCQRHLSVRLIGLRCGLVRLPRPSRVAQGASQEEFDLAIEAAEIVVGPALDGFEDLAVYA